MSISDAWWAAWWETDFSWDGLAKQVWEGCAVTTDGQVVAAKDAPAGARAATLQDYWRDQENDLIASPVSGKRFTRAHLPLAWENGAPTEKAGWADDALDPILSAKLAAANAQRVETSTLGGVEGADWRAQYQGIVFLAFFVEVVVKDRTDKDRISLQLRCDNAAFSGEISFGRAAFTAEASFVNAVFATDAWFNNSTFAAGASFTNAIFAADAWFSNTTFAAHASFASVTFTGHTWFNLATFAARTTFDDAAFASHAWFANTVFVASSSFARAAFLKPAQFDGAAFAAHVRFDSAAFAADVRFSGASAMLYTPESTQDLRMRAVGEGQFEGDLNIGGGPTAISRRAFKTIQAENAVFFGDVWFDNRDILGPSSFRNTTFLGTAIFHGSALHQGVSFHGACFEDALAPKRRAPAPEAGLQRLFAAAQRCGQDTGEENIDENNWRAQFEKIRQTRAEAFVAFGAQLSEDAIKTLRFLPPAQQNARRRAAQNQRYAFVEDCFRTLKLAMENNRNRAEEGRFFKLELQARRQRRERAVPWWERWASDVYGRWSDYGNSILRPFAWLLLFFVPAFTLLYLTLGTAPLRAPNIEESIEALTFSFSRILPFGPWAQTQGPLMEGLLNIEAGRTGFAAIWDTLTALGVRLLASLQSLIAIVLVFLAGLAVRRRFQIN